MDERPLEGVVADMDGVVTRTAALHERAWTEVLTAFLAARQRAARPGEDLRPCDARDYRRHLDGRPRFVGLRAFLAARAVALPEGEPHDPADAHTVQGLGRRKNERFQELLDEDGVDVWQDTVAALARWRRGGLRIAIVSASRSCRRVLQAARLLERVDAVVGGDDIGELGLAGKRGAMLEAARRIGVDPGDAAVLEDAEAGVRAARQAGFRSVIGVDRGGHAEALAAAGDDATTADVFRVRLMRRVRSALAERAAFEGWRDGRPLALFIDFDGTLSPIVDVPAEAALVPGMAAALTALAARWPLAVVSGRDRVDVAARVGLTGVAYAGSHGLDIALPDGAVVTLPQAEQTEGALAAAWERLEAGLAGIPGAELEAKRFSLAVHHRRVAPAQIGAVEAAVQAALADTTQLRLTHGKRVFELRPAVDWDKGTAVRCLMDALGVDPALTLPLYIGDDVTDEDAFARLGGDGPGIYVGPEVSDTLADWRLPNPLAVLDFLRWLATRPVTASTG